jgi:hypothetical protein
MYLIDDSYFTGKINIPNGSTEYNGSTIEPIDDYINKYGRMFMRETLGNVLFKDLNLNLTDGELNSNATAKWVNLINGKEYVKNGTTYTWQGIKGGCDLYKDSVLAYFVYLNYFEITYFTGFSLASTEAKNATVINPSNHMVEVWNDFVNLYQGSCDNNPVNYFRGVDRIFIDHYANSNSGFVSYMQFLLDNETDYPNIPVRTLQYKNSLGI